MLNQNEHTGMNRQECINKVRDLISGIKVAMVTTLNTDGTFHSRPMWTQEAELNGELWFLTRSDSSKATEIQTDGHVTATYANPNDNRYIAVYGRGELLRDREKAKQYWNELYRAWFPQGLDDPSLALIRVTVESAEYWDSPSSKVVQLVGFVKAGLTGKAYQPGPEQHGKLKMTR